MFNNTQCKKFVTKWLGGVCSATALGGIWLATAIVHPSVSKAITMVEMPAYVFSAITVQGNESLMLCTNKLLGDGSVRTLIGLLDVADSTRFVRGTTPIGGSLDRQKGGCYMLLPAVAPAGAGALARTGIPVIYLMGANTNSAGARHGLVSSLQLVAADGSVKVVKEPTLHESVALPAVQ